MAADINKVILVGRLTRDCESKQIANNNLCTFSVAVNRRANQGGEWKDEVSYFDIELWGSLGSALGGYLTKGKQIAVEGALRQNRWESPDGQKHSRVIITANNIQLLGNRGDSNSGGGGGAQNFNSNTSYSGGNTAPSSDVSTSNAGASNSDFQDDIPF